MGRTRAAQQPVIFPGREEGEEIVTLGIQASSHGCVIGWRACTTTRLRDPLPFGSGNGTTCIRDHCTYCARSTGVNLWKRVGGGRGWLRNKNGRL